MPRAWLPWFMKISAAALYTGQECLRRVRDHLEPARLRDEDAFDREVVAGGAAQAEGVPGRVHGDLRGRDEDHAADLVAVGVAAVLLAVVDHALGGEPVRVAAAARNRPAPADHVARLRRVVATARPIGRAVPATMPRLPQILRTSSPGMNPAKAAHWAAIITHQPAEPSTFATSSTTFAALIGSACTPPSSSGIMRWKRPASRKALTSDSGSLPSRSMSLAAARI